MPSISWWKPTYEKITSSNNLNDIVTQIFQTSDNFIMVKTSLNDWGGSSGFNSQHPTKGSKINHWEETEKKIMKGFVFSAF